jgi:mannose-6-phosphate isomerase-like protein (cupin superfamily)
MKTMRAVFLALTFTLATVPVLQADQGAKVTESVNVVEYGPKPSDLSPAPTGTLVHDGEYLKTGQLARAEMQLPAGNITRLGANTLFNYSVDSNTVDLQSGTILFCKKKNTSELSIKTAAVTAGITGTTGFVNVHGKTYIFGIVEGKATAHAGGQSFPIGAGEILEFRPGAKPLVFAFDVPKFLRTSPLITKFKGRLPNQAQIDAEVASYQDDVHRGFIQPPSGAIDYSGEIPGLSTPAYDSALHAQGGPGNSSGTSRPSGSFNPSSGN